MRSTAGWTGGGGTVAMTALGLAMVLALSTPPAARGQAAADGAAGKGAEGTDKAGERKLPEEKSSTTRHSITLDGQRIAYTATG
jgi:hypothetical protein